MLGSVTQLIVGQGEFVALGRVFISQDNLQTLWGGDEVIGVSLTVPCTTFCGYRSVFDC